MGNTWKHIQTTLKHVAFSADWTVHTNTEGSNTIQSNWRPFYFKKSRSIQGPSSSLSMCHTIKQVSSSSNSKYFSYFQHVRDSEYQNDVAVSFWSASTGRFTGSSKIPNFSFSEGLPSVLQFKGSFDRNAGVGTPQDVGGSVPQQTSYHQQSTESIMYRFKKCYFQKLTPETNRIKLRTENTENGNKH